MNVAIILTVVWVIIIMILLKKRKNKRLYKLLEEFPSYPTYPLIGNMNMLWGSPNGLLLRVKKLMQHHERLLFWMGPMPCLFIKRYDDIMTILAHNHNRDTLELGNEWSGMAILNANYKEWKKSRRILAPAFTSRMFSKYVEVFDRQSTMLVEKLKPIADTGKIVDITEYTIAANMDIIVENTVGISILSVGNPGKVFSEAMLKALRALAYRFMSIWLHSGIIHSMYLYVTGASNIIQQLRLLPTMGIEKKMNTFKNLPEDQSKNVNASTAIIDLLIKAHLNDETFTKTRMTDELLHVIGAGAETTALNLNFLMLMLAVHQDIQQKVYQEIIRVADDNGKLTADHLINLKYLEQCIKETTRMFSPVAVTSRRTYKECTLNDNTIVPADTFVLVFVHLANSDSNLFKDPLKWDPEHFSDQAIAERPKGTNQLSFGYGSRFCIGAKYAAMSIKVQIAHILRNYHLSTDIENFSIDDCTIDLCIRSKIGYPIKFTSRRSA